MCGHVPYVHVWTAQWMHGGASHQYRRIGKRTSWLVLLSILLCFVCGEGGVEIMYFV